MKQGGEGNDYSERCPPHPGFVYGLCSRCEAEEDKAAGGDPGVAVGHETMNQGRDSDGGDGDDAEPCPPHPEIAATGEGAGGSSSRVTVANTDRAVRALKALAAAKSIAASDMETLIRQRKLILILDLDHTLLNSTGLNILSRAEQAKGLTPATSGDPRIDLFRLDSDNLGMLVKLRPFVRGFLKQASSMFEMHVYTLGNQGYAKAAMDLLDPDGVYFGSRVVSIEESMSIQGDTKSLGVIPGADPVAVVILHDTDVAWLRHQTTSYSRTGTATSSTCRKSRHDIPSLPEQGLDEMENDGSLAVVLGVLKRVHQAFFNGHRTDVKEVIRELRRQVLCGCTVAFSYLEEHMEHCPQSTLMWALAERLGTVCRKDVDETVTHVVAENPGIQKAQWAGDNGKSLVNLEWINTAGFRLCRLDEQGFPVTALGVERRHAVRDPILLHAAVGLIKLQRWYQENRGHED